MRMANLVAGALLFALSLALLFWLIPWQVEESFDGSVSPRLLPQICAAGIGLRAIILFVTNLRASPDTNDALPVTGQDVKALLVIGGLLALGIYLFTIAGPIVACTVLVTGILFAMGERRILPFILIPVILLSGSWVLFYKVLGTAIQ